MFSRCTALTTAPTLPATTLAYGCYEWMFDGCTSLTTAPALPATTLVNECYRQMFSGCTSLNSITTYANDISATNCLQNWLQNVAPTGTFHNEGTAVYTTDSPSGIPTGWSEPVTSSGYFYLENTSRFIDDEIVITSSGNAPVFDIYYSYDAIDWDLLGTTGGSDIINQILSKYFKIGMGKAVLITDGVVIGICSLVFSLNEILYGFILIYIISYMVDKIIIGISSSKTFYIVTKQPKEVKDYIIRDLNHSVTNFF